MADYSIILVEPLYEGNIGSIARIMKNFGLSEFADDKCAVFARSRLLDDT